MIPTSILNKSIITPFNKGKPDPIQTPLKNYLIGQTSFSAAFGFLACRLPVLQSAALGMATEICRYATDCAIDQLSTKFSFIRDNKTAVKTALLAGSFFLAKVLINTVFPGSSTFFKAGVLMSTVYLLGEPIHKGLAAAAKGVYAAATQDKTVKQSLTDIKNDIYTQYPAAAQKIANLWNYFFRSNENRLDADNT